MSKITITKMVTGDYSLNFGGDPYNQMGILVKAADLADLPAACLSALREQEPTRSPVVFTAAPELCKCALHDFPDVAGRKPCGLFFKQDPDWPDEFCNNTKEDGMYCGHSRACHAEGKDNG